MRLPTAHHFWRNRETATWRPAGPPWPEVEAEVKSKYLELELARPPWLTVGRVTVFLAYKPDLDVFGRSITPISFALLADCRDPARSSAAVGPLLAAAGPEAPFIEVDLPWENVRPQPVPPPPPVPSRSPGLSWPLFVVLGVACLAGALIGWQQKASRTEPASPPPEPAEPAAVVVVEPQAAEAVIPSLCAAANLWPGLYGCPRAFVEAKCGGADQAPAFDRWLKSEAGASACAFGVDWRRNNYHREEDRLSSEERRLIRDFFERPDGRDADE